MIELCCYHFSCEAGPTADELQPLSFPLDDRTAASLRGARDKKRALDAVMPRIREMVGIPKAHVVVRHPTIAIIRR